MTFAVFENCKAITMAVRIHFTEFRTNAVTLLSCDRCLFATTNYFIKKIVSKAIGFIAAKFAV